MVHSEVELNKAWQHALPNELIAETKSKVIEELQKSSFSDFKTQN